MADADTKVTRSRYRKVEVRTWGDEKFRNLSPIPPCGQGLWLYLITGPHTGPIPGLFRAGRAAMAEELGWEVEDFDEAFREAFVQGMVKADFKARVVWVPNAIRHNRPESPNVVRSWAAEFDLIPECALKWDALESLKANVYGLGEAFSKAFDETFGKAIPKASDKPSSKAMPNQEQEQEQEQEDRSSLRSDSSAPLALTPGPVEPTDLKTRRTARIAEIAEEARTAYNAILAKPKGLLTACTVLNKPRLKAVEKALPTARAICRQLSGSERITPDFWTQFFETVSEDAWHSGRGPYKPPHENWRPDFEYLLREDVMAKLFDRAMTEDAA